MKPLLTIATFLVAAHLAGASLLAAESATASAAACPVTGRPIDKAVSIDYLGANCTSPSRPASPSFRPSRPAMQWGPTINWR